MATHVSPGEPPEAEPVIVEVVDGAAVLTLEDGAQLQFSVSELTAALAIDELAERRAS